MVNTFRKVKGVQTFYCLAMLLLLYVLTTCTTCVHTRINFVPVPVVPTKTKTQTL